MCNHLFVGTGLRENLRTNLALFILSWNYFCFPGILISLVTKPIEGTSRDKADSASSSLLIWCRGSFPIEGVRSRTHRHFAFTSSPRIEATMKILLRMIAKETRLVRFQNVQPLVNRNRICKDVGA
mmetsp:Transcript_3239/g.6100  ORF Transcript_3239/g.6100 Transcript_3239/m.6100 type:complete len:126 (+) Transcript_3239:927-1304(+)